MKVIITDECLKIMKTARNGIEKIQKALNGKSIPYVSGSPLRWMIKDKNNKPKAIPDGYAVQLDLLSDIIRSIEDFGEAL